MIKQSHLWGQEKRDVRQGDRCVGQGPKEQGSLEDVYIESFILRAWLGSGQQAGDPGKSDVAVQVHGCLLRAICFPPSPPI